MRDAGCVTASPTPQPSTLNLQPSTLQPSPLNPQPSTLNPPTLNPSEVLGQSFGDVIVVFVQHRADGCLGLGELRSGAFHQLAVGFFGLDNEQPRIHDAGKPGRDTDLADRRHVENDVV